MAGRSVIAKHALLLWSVLLFVAMAWMAFIGLRDKRPALLLFAVFCLFYLLVRPLMLLTGLYADFAGLHFGAEVLWLHKLWAVFANVTLSLIFIQVAYWARPAAIPSWVINWPRWSTRSSSLFIAVWFALVALASMRQVSAVTGVFFGFVLFGGSYFLTRRAHERRPVLLVSIGIAGVAIALMASVERRDWAVALFAIGWTALLSDSRSSMRQVLYGLGLAGVVAYVAMALRTEGSVADRFVQADSRIFIAIAEWELDFPLVYDDLVVLFDRVPSDEGYLFGESLAKPFYAWVPRGIWSGKPQTLSREFTERFNARFYDAGGSEPLTFVGDLYWNFGWFGLLLCLLLGRLQRAIDDAYLLGRVMARISDRLARPVLAFTTTLSAMMFYLYRGPGDTVWLNFGALILTLWMLARLQEAIWEAA
jgi:hypothetical protein